MTTIARNVDRHRTTPAGPLQPSTTVPGLDQLLESGAQ